MYNTEEQFRFRAGIRHFVKDSDYNERSHDVIWSGGYDSTFILLALCELKKEGDIKTQINVLTLDGVGARAMVKKERESREAILKLIREKYNFQIEEYNISLETHNINHNGKHIDGFNLQHLYLSTAMLNSSHKSIMYYGLNGDDHSTIRFSSLVDMVKSIDEFYIKDYSTILAAPLMLFTKAEIVYAMKRYFPEYDKLIWTCQNPNYIEIENSTDEKYSLEPCNECTKCLEYHAALNQIIFDKKVVHNDNDRDKLENEVNNIINVDKRRLGESIKCSEAVSVNDEYEIVKEEDSPEYKETQRKLIDMRSKHVEPVISEVKYKDVDGINTKVQIVMPPISEGKFNIRPINTLKPHRISISKKDVPVLSEAAIIDIGNKMSAQTERFINRRKNVYFDKDLANKIEIVGNDELAKIQEGTIKYLKSDLDGSIYEYDEDKIIEVPNELEEIKNIAVLSRVSTIDKVICKLPIEKMEKHLKDDK